MEMLNIWITLKLAAYGIAAIAVVIYAVKIYKDYH